MTEEQKQQNRERARRWQLANPERYKARQAAHYRKNAEELKRRAHQRRQERIDEVRGYDRARAAANRAEKAEYDRVYRAANAEKIREAKARWLKTPEGRAHSRTNCARRRARQKGLDCGCVTREALHAIWEYDEGQCYACGAPGEHFDHVNALARGGRHCIANLRVACVSCNTGKAHRPLEYLLTRLRERGVPISVRLTLPPLPCPKEEVPS